MKAVITVTGKDAVGIIAEVSAVCAQNNANIIDITQSVRSEYFAMIMLVEINALKIKFADFADMLADIVSFCRAKAKSENEAQKFSFF